MALPPSPGEGKSKKKVNPLSDLIETEKVYVDLLTGIMRKVASAWSRQNLPPPELDKMFRNIESIYKANRALLAKLKEIGTNPSSPKALGDLLMRWIEDLEAPYTKYAETWVSGFDEWEPVQSNPRLRTTLAIFSSSNPPPLPSSGPAHPAEPPLWTLGNLFLLPKGRLRYYRKLYSRLLKSTTPGRSDHRLLTGAIDKLDRLLTVLDERTVINVWGDEQPLPPPPPAEVLGEDEVVIDLRTRDSTMPLAPPSQRESNSTQDSRGVSIASQDTAPTSAAPSRDSNTSMTMPIIDLERRLSTERTLDIFTMQPKQVKLQIAPPNLHYARQMFASVDVFMTVTPKATGVEVVQERGHVYILTDLLLMCERMLPHEMSARGPNGPDMWLLYPPLAGKHLRVEPVEENALAVTILRKETVYMYAESQQARDKLLHEFLECIDLMGGKNQPPPPPVPKLPPMNDTSHGPSSYAPSPPRVASPNSMPLSRSSSERGQSPPVAGMERIALSDAPRGLPMHPAPGQFPQRSTSGSSFGPGQIMPPGPGQTMPPGPGQLMQAGNFGPGPVFAPQPIPGQTIVAPPRGTSQRSGSVPPPQGQMGPPYPQGSVSRGPSPYGAFGSRPMSDRSSGGGPPLRKSSSSHSMASEYERNRLTANGPLPPMPNYPDGLAPPSRPFIPRTDSSSSLSSLGTKPILPSAQLSMRSIAATSFADPSPPSSPVEETPRNIGPVSSRITCTIKCKVFLQEHHAKWKSLGSAQLRLYHESPTNVKQLVVGQDKKKPLISTIVLEDGVERVGKTGVAVELSDKGLRTGVVYMIQTKDEKAANELFTSLLAGSDRSEVGGR
ncbi:hypothetical protein PHLGIDRAFT_61638 [Phlebiopsis gigantea 11061_1 CR5-6]|uniref:DH domain-containing protein n=1 Tax=Phlebiopsis gigantea (strain 11061_1 CR5-6) TaxID=745531 RepID=A0A0C3P3B0_PHLG1|nr:hypothetical protein PHLGIDRAFT_61638 [Phlebiopsis gigantea 11061_1 CR5-6]